MKLPLKQILSLYLMMTTLAVSANDFLQKTDSRYQKIEQILNNLSKVSGNGQTLPKLFVENQGVGASIIAYFDRGNYAIVTELELYNLLQQRYGERVDDALSIILGHELAHFYQHHVSGHDCNDADIGNTLIIQEMEADLQGLYYTFQAGYRTTDIAIEVMELIYETYHLEEGGSCNYPTLDKRKSVIKEGIETVEQHIRIYENANFLVMLQEYSKAVILYEHIARLFPTADVLNNIGVCYAGLALEAIGSKVSYPLLIEELTVISKQQIDKVSLDTSEMADEYLKRGEQALNRALLLDRGYELAYLNLACLMHLKQRFTSNIITKEERNHNLKLYGLYTQKNEYFYLMEAIIAYDEGRMRAANKAISEAININSNELIKSNHCIISKQNCDDTSTTNTSLKTIEINKNISPKSISIQNADFYVGLSFQNASNTVYNYLQFDLDVRAKQKSYYWEKRTQPIPQLKDKSQSDVKKFLGTPDIVILNSQQTIFLYRSSGLLLFFKDTQQEDYHYRYLSF